MVGLFAASLVALRTRLSTGLRFGRGRKTGMRELEGDHALAWHVAEYLAARLGHSPDDVSIHLVPEIDSPDDQSPVDLVVDVADERWAIEHTVVESFENQLQDDVRVGQFAQVVSSDVRHDLPDGHFQLVIPVAALDGVKGDALDDLSADVGASIRDLAANMAAEGRTKAFVTRMLSGNEVVTAFQLQYRPPIEEWTRGFDVARWKPEGTEELRLNRVQRALNDKLPKLRSMVPTSADRTVLVLEDRDIALAHPWLIQDAIERSDVPNGMADWTVVVETGIHGSFVTVIFEADTPITEKAVSLSIERS